MPKNRNYGPNYGDIYNENSELKTDSTPFNLEVQIGEFDGYKAIDKFGLNEDITTASDPEDIWEGGGVYNFDADGTAPIVSLISDDASDTQDIKIEGLDIDGNETIQTITLNGTTRVALDTPLWRVYRMENEGTTNLTGTVYCYIGTGGVPAQADQRAIIISSNNQTQMAVYTVPAGKVGFLVRGEIGIEWEGGVFSGTEFARVCYASRRFGKVFKTKKTITCTTSGDSIYKDDRSFPDIIPALTDIKLLVKEVSATMGAWGTFDILLIDEDKLSNEYLQSIGQPGY